MKNASASSGRSRRVAPRGPTHVVLPPALDRAPGPRPVATRRSSRRSCRATASAKGSSGAGREALDALAAGEHGGPGKADEDRLGEVRVPHHQLALRQGGELDLGGRREGGIGGRRELVHVHPAEHRGAGVAHDPPLHLGAELLGGEQHQPQIAAPLGEIEQHLPNVGVGALGGGVLVELVHEHDDVIHTQIATLEMLPGAWRRPGRRPGPVPAGRGRRRPRRARSGRQRRPTEDRGRRRRRSRAPSIGSRCCSGGSGSCGWSRRGGSATPRRPSRAPP